MIKVINVYAADKTCIRQAALSLVYKTVLGLQTHFKWIILYIAVDWFEPVIIFFKKEYACVCVHMHVCERECVLHLYLSYLSQQSLI